MLRKKIISFAIAALPLVSLGIFAAPINDQHNNKQHHNNQHIVVAPNCLLKNLGEYHRTLSSNSALSLIETNDQGIHQLIALKTQRKKICGGFIEATTAFEKFNAEHFYEKDNAKKFLTEYTLSPEKNNNLAYEIQYPTEVNQLISQMNPEDMWTDLTTLSSFQDRYADGENGVKAAEWIKTQIETIAKNTGHEDVTVNFIETKGYRQPSVVVKIGTSEEPGIVIGGHLDTLSSIRSKKPGADDDGSGSVTVLEVARTLLSSGMHFKKPIYFIWYAAEEEGLIGSQNVVSNFKEKNIPISAVIQFDMTGYAYQNDLTLWLINDYVDKNLTGYLEKLITAYVKQPVQYTKCGYACSDHAIWTKNGFVASMPFEAAFGQDDPDIHTSRDTMEKLSLAHMSDYAKLGIAFAVELAEPIL